jgi:hypothetical protein
VGERELFFDFFGKVMRYTQQFTHSHVLDQMCGPECPQELTVNLLDLLLFYFQAKQFILLWTCEI